MKRNSEAVRLVAQTLYQVQRLRTALQHDRYGTAGTIEQLLTLGQGRELDQPPEVQRASRLFGRVKLRQSAVNNDQIGPTELRAGLMIFPVGETSPHHFLHGAHVVVPDHLFDVEVAIVTF